MKEPAFLNKHGVLSIHKEHNIDTHRHGRKNNTRAQSAPSKERTTAEKGKGRKGQPHQSETASTHKGNTSDFTSDKPAAHTEVGSKYTDKTSNDAKTRKTRFPENNPQKQRNCEYVKSLLDFIRMQTNTHTDSGRKKMHLVDLANEILSEFSALDVSSERNLIQNLKYIKDVLGQNLNSHELQYNLYSEISRENESIFFQRQGTWPVCGVCVLNNAIQRELFSFQFLSETADDLWMIQIIDQGISLTNDIQRQRGTHGDFSFDVLSEAAKRKSYELVNLRTSVFRFPFSSDTDLKDNMFHYFNTPGVSASFIIKLGQYEHYVSIIYKNSIFFLLDSSKDYVARKTSEEVLIFIRGELTHTMCAVYGIVKQDTRGASKNDGLTSNKDKGENRQRSDNHGNDCDSETENYFDTDVNDNGNTNTLDPKLKSNFKNNSYFRDKDNDNSTNKSSEHTANRNMDPMASLQTVHGGTLNICAEHLNCLKEKQYINNFIIDFISEEIMFIAPSIYILETVFSACVNRNATFNILKERYKSSDLVLIPVHLPNERHWILFIIDRKVKRWTVFDSLQGMKYKYENIKVHIQRTISEIADYEWYIDSSFEPYKQSDVFSCGLHVIAMMILRSCNVDQSNINPSSTTWANTVYRLRTSIQRYIATFDIHDGKY